MKEQIFLTGSTGFIGEKLAARLLSEGHRLNLLVRNPEKSTFWGQPNVRFFQGDLMNAKVIMDGMAGCSKVYHLAGFARTWAKHSREFYDTNVNGTQNILEAAKKNGIEKVVATSTCAVLGPSFFMPINEASPRTLPFFNHYDRSKHLMERLVKHYVKNGLNVVIVNPPRVYGPGLEGESNSVVGIIKKYLKGDWKFIPSQDRLGSYAFIDDVVKGHVLAMEKGRAGERYILGGDNRPFEDIFKLVRKSTGVKKTLYKVPVKIVLLLSLIESSVSKLFRKKPKLPYDWSNKLTYDWALSSEKAMSELGYSITSFEEGIAKTTEWIQSQQSTARVLITGASSGIGKSLARQFAERKMNLLLVSLPDTGLREVAEELQTDFNVKVDYFETDLTQPKSVDSLYNWFRDNKFQLQILINNAGIGHQGLFSDLDTGLAQKIIELNVTSVVLMTRTFIPELVNSGEAKILNVASMAGMFPIPNKAVYSASKSFVVSFSRSLRHELRSIGIKVSCLCPGGTLTSPEIVERIMKKGRLGRSFAMTPDVLAQKCIEKILQGKELIIPAWYNRAIVKLSQIVPKNLVPQVTSRIFNH